MPRALSSLISLRGSAADERACFRALRRANRCWGTIVRAFAGDPIAAHAEGCRYVRNKYSVSGPLSDIVITTNGGYPLDQNVYQSVKGMSSAEPLCRQDGVIIMLAKCNDGIGGENFYHQIADCSLIEDQLKAFRRRKRGETLPDQWQSQIYFRVLNKARVILVSDMPPEAVRKMKMYPAEDVSAALSLAEKLVGSADASVAIIPDGVSVIVSTK